MASLKYDVYENILIDVISFTFPPFLHSCDWKLQVPVAFPTEFACWKSAINHKSQSPETLT